MVRKELIKRSPLRILEKSIHGGLGKGNLAIIASPKGIGKTACLVHIATDSLLMGKHIIHVSFSARTDHIISWYEDIFKEIARKRNLESAMEVHDDIIRNRVIMNFNQESIKTDQVVKSLKAMILGGNFSADQIVVDGYDFSNSNPEEFMVMKNFAVELGTSIWFSSSTLADDLEGRTSGVPKSLEPYMDFVSVLITLEDKQDHINLRLVKDHDAYTKEDLDIRLDPRTLLIAEDI